MKISKLTNDLSVSPQIQISDLPKIADLGFQTIIINRPDWEEPGQPSRRALEAAAQDYGLVTHYIPVAPGQLDDGKVALFGAALSASAGPTLAFCKTGMRSSGLWKRYDKKARPTSSLLDKLAGSIKQLRTAFSDRA